MIELRWLIEPEIREERGDHRVITYRAERRRLQYRWVDSELYAKYEAPLYAPWRDVPEVGGDGRD